MLLWTQHHASDVSSSISSFFAALQSGAGLLHGFVERPKQRRHRCKDPTKLDINSLTGEERVPVVHRGTGRRVEHIHANINSICTSVYLHFYF